MWVIGFIGVSLIFLVANISSKIGRNKYAFSNDELESMNKEMCGKSKEECRRILKKYEKIAKIRNENNNNRAL